MVAPAAHVSRTVSFRTLFAERVHARTYWLPIAFGVIAFVLLFASPTATLVHEWFTNDDANYGILLFPVALWLAWRQGILADAAPRVVAGSVLIGGAVGIRLVGAIASEFFSQRFAIWLAIVGIVVFCFGWKQLRHWWLPLAILVLAIPLPALILNRLAIPLQFQASSLGTAMIKWRGIPVRTDGNVIQLPNAILFVAEACSGLRSLSALIALGVLLCGMYLSTWPARMLLLLLVVPIAILLNGFRIFLTAFLVYFVDPDLASGLAHEREGLLMFAAAFLILGAVTAIIRFAERRIRPAAAYV